MISWVVLLIGLCSFFGPASLVLAVASRLVFTRILFGLMACLCSGMMWFLFGTFYGDSVLAEILAYFMTIPKESY